MRAYLRIKESNRLSNRHS